MKTVILIATLLFAFDSMARVNSHAKKKNSSRAPASAIMVSQTKKSTVYRFTDKVKGKNMVCYFSEAKKGKAANKASDVKCYPNKGR